MHNVCYYFAIASSPMIKCERNYHPGLSNEKCASLLIQENKKLTPDEVGPSNDIDHTNLYAYMIMITTRLNPQYSNCTPAE